MRNRDNLKEEFREEAIKLFLAKGFAGVTTNELVHVVGVSKGALYWHFKHKDDLVRGMIDEYGSEFIDASCRVVDACGGDFTTRFKAFYKFTSEFGRDHGELLLVFITLPVEFAGSGTDLETKMKEQHVRYNKIIQGLIEDGIKDGSVPKEIQPNMYASFIVGALVGSLLNWYFLGSLHKGDSVSNKKLAIIQQNKLIQAVVSGEVSPPNTMCVFREIGKMKKSSIE